MLYQTHLCLQFEDLKSEQVTNKHIIMRWNQVRDYLLGNFDPPTHLMINVDHSFTYSLDSVFIVPLLIESSPKLMRCELMVWDRKSNILAVSYK